MKTKLLILVGFVLAFAAGMVVGAGRRDVTTSSAASPNGNAPTTNPSTRPSRHRGFLAAELNLTPEQQEQMNQIWSETARRGGRERDDERRQLRKEREDAIAALIRAEDRAKYDQVLSSYTQQMESLDGQQRANFQAAVERTKQLLTPEQRTKYEALLSRNQWGGQRGPGGPPGGPGGPGGMGPGGERGGDRGDHRPDHDGERRAASRPAADESK